MKDIKLTKEELEEVKNLQQSLNSLQEKLGLISLESLNLEIQKEDIKFQVREIINQEVIFLEKIHNKYGEGKILLEEN